MNRLTYKSTIIASFIGYVSQAITINFISLLFVTFNETYGIEFSKITVVVTINFMIQLLTDLMASRFAHKIGTRACLLISHILCGVGLIALAVLPSVIDPYAGIIIAACIYGVGGGLLEVMVSPVVEACPTGNKAGVMSVLHSFYCWGVTATVLLCTLFFVIFGVEKWQVLSCILAIVPLANTILFAKVPLYSLSEETEDKPEYKKLFSQKIFILMLFIMACAGASEISVSQWVSAFAEKSFNVSKTMGDVIGVCGFSVFMGFSRVLYGRISRKVAVRNAMLFSVVLCIVSYLMIGLSPHPAVGLAGCMLCGFSVGVFWPGTFSLSTQYVKNGGTTMFALLALAGDLGCSSGPTFVGFISGMFGDNLQTGILCATVIPVVFLFALLSLKKEKKEI